ncbi:MAG: hypothetical protein KIT35_21865 [Piscinibacter sp.]|uniref:hypothetical protein n=1 Tax=Piscinibacter sp. TaxID=1903157 RepID=UPI002582CE02|nr:hypothetical protein [Piscinibacter sp.]MCW5666487.1 hypothetical protein [Piscinibacter sp.]
MKRIEVCAWYLRSEATGKRYKSRWKMTREDALVHDPHAEPVPGTEESREIPESEAERLARQMSKPPRP